MSDTNDLMDLISAIDKIYQRLFVGLEDPEMARLTVVFLNALGREGRGEVVSKLK